MNRISGFTGSLLFPVLLLTVFCQPSWAETYDDCFYNVVLEATGAAALHNSGHLLEITGLDTYPGGEDGVRIDLSETGGDWSVGLPSLDTTGSLPADASLSFSTIGTVDYIPDRTIAETYLTKESDGSWSFGVNSAGTTYRLEAYNQGVLVFSETYTGTGKVNPGHWSTQPPYSGAALSADVQDPFDLDLWLWEVSFYCDVIYTAYDPGGGEHEVDELVISVMDLPYMDVAVADMRFEASDVATLEWSHCIIGEFSSDNGSFEAREADLAQDNFPTSGVINPVDLGSHSVRFDAARNISAPEDMANTPGDSLTFSAAPYREGAVLGGRPKGYYKLFPNPLFDTYRASGLPNGGWVECDSIYNATGSVVADRWSFDLPDEGFFFPGDVIHYYFEMQEDLLGDVLTFTLPADTTGFSSLSGSTYSQLYTVRALPSLRGDGFGGIEQPGILFWDDNGGDHLDPDDDDDTWSDMDEMAMYTFAFQNLGYVEGVDYDIYRTRDPLAGLGNGLGGRATLGTIDDYTDILYSCGDLNINTLSNGDYENDAGDDIGLLTDWLESDDKDILLMGNNLAFDLSQSGVEADNLLSNWIGVSFDGRDLAPLLSRPGNYEVQTLAGNPVFSAMQNWLAYGCDLCSQMPDAVTVTGTGVALAEYLDPWGIPGAYTYAAGSLNEVGPSPYTQRVIYLPYDLKNILGDGPSGTSAIAARTGVLDEVLTYFGQTGSGSPTAVPERPVVGVNAYPNPFNPMVRIDYSGVRGDRMTMDVYNIRGQHVVSLFDDRLAAESGFVTWNGTRSDGSAMPSGVYFLKTKVGNEELSDKLTLVR